MRIITRICVTGIILAIFLGLLYVPGAESATYKMAPTPAQVQTSNVQRPISDTGQIRDFDLLTPNSGWLLLGQALFMTHDNGGSWTAITPPGATRLWAVDFLDERQGWAITSPQTETGLSAFDVQLWTTFDGGLNWQSAGGLIEPFPELAGMQPEAVYLFFVEPGTGWIVFMQPSTSNFSLGRLFRTQDGGLTWQPLSIPIAAPLFFVDPQTGYTQGGATGEERYASLDGGASWAAVEELPAEAATYFERFSHSLLNNQPDAPALQTAMLDGSNGWALETTGECAADQPKGARVCKQTQRLLRTIDVAVSWTKVNLPTGSDALISLFSAPSDSTPLTPNPDLDSQSLIPNSISTGHAFDKCEIATLNQLQEWWDKSPYAAVNLYIGGISRACSNRALTASYLASIDRQGWRLIPTWVGPQAACSGYKNRINYDPNKAYQQGIDEADAAADMADVLKLWGQPIYYDLEWFNTNDTACLESAKAFIDAWSGQLHIRGLVAGVYGSPCAGLTDFYTLDNVPDGVWIANWIYDEYDPGATVWNAYCMGNGYWPNHQRLRQYAGGHYETWGNVTLNIDSNVMDGYVAQAYGQPMQVCPQPQNASSGVILYTNPGFDCGGRQSGYGYVWRQGGGISNINGFFEDRASSIYIPAGFSVRLYETVGGGGGTTCLNASTEDFTGLTFGNGHGLNDQISSLAIFSGQDCINPAEVPKADTTPPQVTISSPAAHGYINANSAVPLSIQASLQDAGSGLSHAQFFAGYDSGTGWAWQPLGWDLNGSDGWSANWDQSIVGDMAEIGFYVFAWDQAGNGAGYSALHISLDRVKPGSSMTALPAHVDSSVLHVSWQGSDNFSGIASYDLQVQDNGAWSNWLSGTTKTSEIYYGQLGHSYGFRVRAIDKAGNQGTYPNSAQTVTTIKACATDAYEADNDRAHAKALALGNLQSHTFCGLGDQDWLAVSLQGGQVYQFSTLNLGADTDTLLSLYDAYGNLLAESDDLNSANLSSGILYRPASSATVYLRVVDTDARVGGNAVSYDILGASVQVLFLPSIFR